MTPERVPCRARHAIAVPPGFDFWRTVRSHGWYDLPPFRADLQGRTLERLLLVSGDTPVLARVAGGAGRLRVVLEARRPLTAGKRAGVLAALRSCFRLDEDFAAFHAAVRAHPRHRWIATAGAGRLLRAPTVFEDVVKMLCTTNCSWTMTSLMVGNLVARYGTAWDAERSAFPTAAQLAAATEAGLRREVRAGYRAPSLLRFAEDVAAGRIDVESWRQSPLPTGELYAQLLAVHGIGPYAAGSLLKLLGRYDYLALDSWVRARYASLYARGRRVSDRTIERRYRKFGTWRGLFFWLEMTRYWHDEKFVKGKDARTEGDG
jgi:3-methyladenine DNA glycosylase/8-oxoguanine DNA glycosylase